MDDNTISFEITQRLGIISEGGKAWKRELNLVSWNGREPKIDLRDWSEDHTRMGRGLTLSRDEACALLGILGSYLKRSATVNSEERR